MESPNDCPYCGSAEVCGIVIGRERMYGLGGTFAYSSCGGCGSLSLRDRGVDLAAYYPESYYAHAPLRRSSLVAGISRYVTRRRARFVERLLRDAKCGIHRGARILDVGSGSGRFLRAFKELGYDVAGIDPFLPPLADTQGVSVDRRQLDAIPEPSRPADLVMFNHSLEHVFEPGASLHYAARHLADRGSLVVRIPIASYAWKRYRECWVGLDAPRHVAIPSERGMRMLAQRCGFEVRLVRYDSDESQFEVSEAIERGGTILGSLSWTPLGMVARKVVNIPRMLRAGRLNALGQGDQAAFVLRRA